MKGTAVTFFWLGAAIGIGGVGYGIYLHHSKPKGITDEKLEERQEIGSTLMDVSATMSGLFMTAGWFMNEYGKKAI